MTDEFKAALDAEESVEVALDQVKGYCISTVLLRSRYCDFQGRPYETMMFGRGEWNHQCFRYATRDEAIAGHCKLVVMFTPDD